MTITYKDVSHYNGNYHPTGPTAAKATEGTGFTDPQFATTRSRTRAGGWPFIGYHFLHHSNISGQVSHAIAVVGKGQPLMLDVEHGADPNPDDPTLADVYAFADQYKARSGGGLVTLGYIPKWYWSGHWGSPSMTGLNQRGIALISSQYDSRGYTDGLVFPGSNDPTGWQPYGKCQPKIWQYTSTPIDTNAFKGTQAALGDLWKNGLSDGSNPDNPVEEPVTQAEMHQLITMLLNTKLGSSGPTVGIALQHAASAMTQSELLGASGPTVGVALQSTYQEVQKLVANEPPPPPAAS